MFGGRIVRVNAGGRLFQTFASTLLKFPNSQFGRNIQQSITALEPSLPTRSDDNTTLGAHVSPSTSTPTASLLHATTTTSLSEVPELFLDVNPDVFDLIMSFLRTGRMVLPTTNEPLRSEVMHFLSKEGLMEYAFGVSNGGVSSSGDGGDGDELVDQHNAVVLPDVCVVQLCDHMQHDQGVKRHAITMSYGADGFQLRDLAKRIRKDLQTQLASTFWQVYQTNERSAFFVTTKVANGTADLMTTSISQQVINHTESMGYSLTNSYVTLSPDIVHTNVRMLVHNLIFRRVRLAVPDAGDALAVLEEVESEQQRGEEEEEGDDGEVRRRRRGPEGDEAVHPSLQVHPNFEPPAVGPQSSMWKDAPTTVPTGQRMKNIWGE